MDETRVIRTIKKVMPAVVSITIEKNLRVLEKEMPHEMYNFLPGGGHKIKRQSLRLPDILADQRGMVRVGGGSGFIVDPKGLVMTNKHVISDPHAEYTVILDDGRKFPAEILSCDPVNDVAILRIGAKRLPTIALGDARKLQLGQSVIAIGNALGVFRNTVSLGIVSGLSRAVSAKDEDENAVAQEMRGLIQSDAAINVGNSGGPLVDLQGRVVGINTAVISDAHNICFAIPINAAHRDLDDVRKHGRIMRPLLGVRYLILNDTIQAKMKLPVNYGAYIIAESPHDPGVTKGGPADRVGLREKDIILKFSGKKVTIDHPIQDCLEDCDVGQRVELEILRGSRKFKTKVTLTERR
jgi:serine protease Do